ncbi:hypothetical protein [Bacillus horti]|uniref:Uncharacterized protein n=1 Tax=Caldalkalibacillus horti TaxID=77523 RepID=A0ABT9VYU1_9BACI|nr:hypothetical protein [Bacillus horti]MDQ0166143.1 hypothetical protein [Bacillus horti]
MKKMLTIVVASSFTFLLCFSSGTEVLGNPGGPNVELNSSSVVKEMYERVTAD